VKVLDFNSARKLTQQIIMKDAAHTVVHLCVPCKGTVDKIGATLPELRNALTGKDEAAKRAIYDLAAELIRNNLDGFTVTGRELETKYNLDVEDLAIFYDVYVDFLNEIKDAKN
jgi:hypothetical protein